MLSRDTVLLHLIYLIKIRVLVNLDDDTNYCLMKDNNRRT